MAITDCRFFAGRLFISHCSAPRGRKKKQEEPHHMYGLKPPTEFSQRFGGQAQEFAGQVRGVLTPDPKGDAASPVEPEIFMLRLETAARAVKEAAATSSSSRFVPITLPVAKRSRLEITA